MAKTNWETPHLNTSNKRNEKLVVKDKLTITTQHGWKLSDAARNILAQGDGDQKGSVVVDFSPWENGDYLLHIYQGSGEKIIKITKS